MDPNLIVKKMLGKDIAKTFLDKWDVAELKNEVTKLREQRDEAIKWLELIKPFMPNLIGRAKVKAKLKEFIESTK